MVMGSFEKNILVIAAHPDDEVLGCGGTIARHANSGDHVNILIIAEGSTSRQSKRDRSQVADGSQPLPKLHVLLDQFSVQIVSSFYRGIPIIAWTL